MNRSGFTMVEVVVVLLILSLAAGLSATAWRPVMHDEPASVTSVVARASALAAREQVPVRVVIELSTGKWWITDGSYTLVALDSGRITRAFTDRETLALTVTAGGLIAAPSRLFHDARSAAAWIDWP